VLAIPESAPVGEILAIVGSIAAVALGVPAGVGLHAWPAQPDGRVQRARRGRNRT
jgi:hypothetical protein